MPVFWLIPVLLTISSRMYPDDTESAASVNDARSAENASSAGYPQILYLNTKDALFQQLQYDIRQYYRTSRQLHAKNSYNQFPPLVIFQYQRTEEDDIVSFSARLNLPSDTISTLNRVANPDHFLDLKTVLIPNVPGIFVPVTPETILEEIMFSWRSEQQIGKQIVVTKNGKKVIYLFYAGDRFRPVERAYFLKIFYQFPLADRRITSPFGARINPFTHHTEFHKGVDLGAPEGTDAYAAGTGIVHEVGSDPVYGNYIVISHVGGIQTVYGHLSKIIVKQNQHVTTGLIIGKVGSTGHVTGPHLHFEMRLNGNPKNPLTLLHD